MGNTPKKEESYHGRDNQSTEEREEGGIQGEEGASSPWGRGETWGGETPPTGGVHAGAGEPGDGGTCEHACELGEEVSEGGGGGAAACCPSEEGQQAGRGGS